MGWIGTMGQVKHYLAVVGAERDEHGAYLIRGGTVVTFMGLTGDTAEAVVSDADRWARGAGAQREEGEEAAAGSPHPHPSISVRLMNSVMSSILPSSVNSRLWPMR